MQQTELPVPKPRKGEVLVKVEAASVNPIDWKIQTGGYRPILPRKLPYVAGKWLHMNKQHSINQCKDICVELSRVCVVPIATGTDIAGEVVQVGAGVTGFAAGEKVVAWLDIQVSLRIHALQLSTHSQTAENSALNCG